MKTFEKTIKKFLWFTAIITVCLTAVALFAATGCDKLEKSDGDKSYIYAKVENASEYSNVVEVKLMGYDRNTDRYLELARSDWKDSGFTIVLPETLDPNYLNELRNNGYPTHISDIPSTMTISNKDVKVADIEFWGVDKEGNLVTHFYPFERDEDGIFYTGIFYTYVDSDVTISGCNQREVVVTALDKDNNTYTYEWKRNTTYSVEWKKGWNVWCLSIFKSVPESTTTDQWSTPPINSLKWYGGAKVAYNYL